ncbi:hypothetical protein [Nocardia tengchongensis]|uniref:hypothetical protein n=1 Tax=Nocardia tengchongensis TaxID=2055889 RepID=UPI0036238E07
MLYRWRRAGAHARLRLANQARLAELLDNLDDGQLRRFWDAVAANPIPQDADEALIGPSLPPAAIAGCWVTAYKFDSVRHHADIAVITPQGGRRITAANWPPSPRSEDQAEGFRNQVEAELYGRHLIGQWRNLSDSYYFGSLHLSVMPGEMMLTGYYTGFPHDMEVVAEQWKWVRIEPSSLDGIDLAAVTLQAPALIYALLQDRSHTAGPMTLEDITEAR